MDEKTMLHVGEIMQIIRGKKAFEFREGKGKNLMELRSAPDNSCLAFQIT